MRLIMSFRGQLLASSEITNEVIMQGLDSITFLVPSTQQRLRFFPGIGSMDLFTLRKPGTPTQFVSHPTPPQDEWDGAFAAPPIRVDDRPEEGRLRIDLAVVEGAPEWLAERINPVPPLAPPSAPPRIRGERNRFLVETLDRTAQSILDDTWPKPSREDRVVGASFLRGLGTLMSHAGEIEPEDWHVIPWLLLEATHAGSHIGPQVDIFDDLVSFVGHRLPEPLSMMDIQHNPEPGKASFGRILRAVEDTIRFYARDSMAVECCPPTLAFKILTFCCSAKS